MASFLKIAGSRPPTGSVEWTGVMRPTLGILADDFTGALMVACYLEGAGIYAPLVFDSAAIDGTSSVVVAGARTRTVAVDDALTQVEAFADAFIRAGYRAMVYKTSAGFDSTADGNIGQVADFLADRLELRPVLMAAGFPSFNITTHQGYLFYRGRLVSESIKRYDPLTPMSDPDLVRFLSLQTPHKVGLVDHSQVRKGPVAINEAILRLGDCGHVFLDVSDEADLAAVCAFAAGRGRVFVASDPVAVEYTKLLLGQQQVKPAPSHARGPAVVLAGTVGPVIGRQLDAFSCFYPVLTVDISDPRPVESLAADALEWACLHLAADRPFAVATSAGPDDVARSQTFLGPIGAARRAESILGTLARLLYQKGVRRFVVAGGETSGAVVSSLLVKSVRALPEGPLGTGFCVTEGADRTSFFLKPGKHGGDGLLLDVLRAMENGDS